MNPLDVIIIGGGLAGGTLALALDAQGLEVALVDHERMSTQLEASYDGRALAIAYGCFRQWRALGLAEALEPVAGRIEQILVTDSRAAGVMGAKPSSLMLRFLADEVGDGTEPLGYMLEARHIRQALNTAIEARGIVRHAPCRPVGLKREGGMLAVTLDSGTILTSPLVIGADGRGSWVRQQTGIETIGWDYTQDALVLTVETERDHQGVAHECFIPSGPFAILPLPNKRCNIVWTEQRHTASALMGLPEDVRWAAFERRFGDHLGAVKPVTPIWRYPLSLQVATAMAADRVVLVGDAAHGIHPLAGQGLNLGLKDAFALAQILSGAKTRGEDIGSALVLERYTRARRFDAISMALAMDGFYRLFANDNGKLRLLRDLGMALVDAVPVARKGFAQMAGAEGLI